MISPKGHGATCNSREMVTIHLRYIIDAYKLAEFEEYGRRWITLVNRFGGDHHGYFLPSEGASNVAYALFTFPSLAAYEVYRTTSATDPDCQATMAFEHEARSIISYERTFLRPVTQGL
jgi:NIPSNAP